MKTTILAGVAALAIAGSTAVYAQHRPWFHQHMQLSPQDRAAFADARIAAVKAGLELTPDQQKLWPPVEQAVRDFAKLRIDRANARMNAGEGDHADAATPPDPVARLRQRADRMGETAAALKKIADAADPLYKTLDEGQKRRLMILTHMSHHRFGEGWRHHHERQFGRDGDHFGPGREHLDHEDRDGGHGGAGDWHDGQDSGRL